MQEVVLYCDVFTTVRYPLCGMGAFEACGKAGALDLLVASRMTLSLQVPQINQVQDVFPSLPQDNFLFGCPESQLHTEGRSEVRREVALQE